jgi:uncharacterized OsmC-like protein
MSNHLDPDVGSRVSGYADSNYGRFILSARNNHFVSDARISQGGPGEAASAGEFLLAALVSCGLGLVHASARDSGDPRPDVTLTAEFLRNPEDPTSFASLTLTYAFKGTDRIAAQRYVEHFTSKCPIYNTLKRGGPVEVRIETA